MSGRHQQNRAVLVDQEWAADLIYHLLLPGGRFREKVKAHGGWFYLTDLEEDANPDWCFRVRWAAASEDALLGQLDAVLVARRPQIDAAVRQIEELFYADALVQIRDGKRMIDQTLVVFRESEDFKFANFDATVNRLFQNMAKHFHQAYTNVDMHDLDKFQHYNDFARLFSAALETTTWNKFFSKRGCLGSAISYDSLPKTASGETDFSSLIAAVQRGVRQQP